MFKSNPAIEPLYHMTRVSGNVKTGPMPVSTSGEQTCPPACPYKNNDGCYAKSGPMRFHWQAISQGTRGHTWPEFLEIVATLPLKQLWRHNQAGDLSGLANEIDDGKLQELVTVNKKAGLHGFTYTHKPMWEDLDAKIPVSAKTAARNREAVKKANQGGFTINLSADTLAEADRLAALDIGPVVVVLPQETPESLLTPEGRKVIVCPAQTRDRMTCVNCKLCANTDRDVIIGFQAHGSGSKIVERTLTALNAEHP